MNVSYSWGCRWCWKLSERSCIPSGCLAQGPRPCSGSSGRASEPAGHGTVLGPHCFHAGPLFFIPLRSWWRSGKESVCQGRRHRFDPWVGKIPWRRRRQPPPVLSEIPRTEPGGLPSKGLQRRRAQLSNWTTVTTPLLSSGIIRTPSWVSVWFFPFDISPGVCEPRASLTSSHAVLIH